MLKQISVPCRLGAAVLAFLFLITLSGQPAVAAVSGAWTAADVGAPALRGSAQDAACTATTGCPVFTISGAGTGIGGSADQFMFVQQKLTGDGTIKLRLLSLAGTSTMEAGLMVRESLTASARHVSILASAAGVAVRSRAVAGGATASQAVARGSWLRLERVGSGLIASISSDGTQWTVVSTHAVTLPATVYVGIAVTSRAATALATAMVSSMAVTPTTPTMPSGWSSADIGAVPSPGTASYSSGSFIAASYAAGLAGTKDGFRFVYTRVRGDAKLMTRVVALQGPSSRQAGIVLRASLDPGAAALALVADATGVVFVKRSASGQTAARTRVATALVPVHLRLERVGATMTAAYSTDGSTWKTVTSVAVSLGEEVYAGMAVASGGSSMAAAAFDRLSLISVAANAAPTVSLTSPLPAQLFLPGMAVAMTATASDPDDLVARVDFRVNGVKVASDSSAPYAATWTAGVAGTYSVVAAAADFDGAVTTSAPVLITVGEDLSGGDGGEAPDGPWRLEFGASYDHATVDYYRMDVFLVGGLVPVLSKNIGKPSVDSAGNCRVDVDTLIAGLPAGQYSVVVRAVASDGSTGSSPFYFNR